MALRTPETVDVPAAVPTPDATTMPCPSACAVDVPEAEPTPAKTLAPTAVTTEVPAAEPTMAVIALP